MNKTSPLRSLGMSTALIAIFFFGGFVTSTFAQTSWSSSGEKTTIFTDRSSGGVGIGVSDPSERLEINGAVLLRGGGATFYRSRGSQIYSPGENQLSLYVNGQDRLKINSNGFIGIGTPNPTAKLMVMDNVDGPLMKLNNGTRPAYIEFSRDQFVEKGSVGTLGGLETNLSYNMDYADNSHKFYNPQKNALWLTLGHSGMTLQFAPAGAKQDIYYTAGYDLLFIDTKGKLFTPEGATFGNMPTAYVNTPKEKLEVYGNIKLNGNIKSDGDICIGTCQ